MKRSLILILLLTLLPFTQASAASGLIKGESSSAVYYQATDGKRYVFPNQKIYFSWYADFSNVVTISDKALAEIPLGGNVFYKPNSRLVKITTDPKVYWVGEFGVLHHIVSEKVAQDFFGSDWVSKIDDLPDAFFAGYTIGEPIGADFSLSTEDAWTIDDNHQLSERGKALAEKNSINGQKKEPQAIIDEGQQPESINLTVTVEDQDATLSWFVSGGNTNYGFIAVKSTEPEPTYPKDDYIQVADTSATQYKWKNLPNNSAYYFRICRLNSDGSCGTYSDQESALIGVSAKTPSITLSGYVENGRANLSWETEWLSPNYGFYLVRSSQANPKYKINPGVWIEKQEESFNWSGLSAGTYHFRICRYTGTVNDDCEYYSNDLELTIE